MSKAKKIVFPSTTLALSFYISVLFGIGTILGYLITNLFCKKFLETGKLKPIIFGPGGLKIHLHHWLSGSLIFFIIYLSGYMCFVPKILLGALGGMVAHDLYLDKEWYKVIIKKRSV
ncbi:hypothetical protein J7J23_00275 [bacterium]|nr:hypothetical protein [bacterium]